MLLFLVSGFFFFWQQFSHLSPRSTIFLLKCIGASSRKEHPACSGFLEARVEGCEPLCPGLVSDAGGVWVAARGGLNAEKALSSPSSPRSLPPLPDCEEEDGMRLEGFGGYHDCPGPGPEGTQSVGKLC